MSKIIMYRCRSLTVPSWYVAEQADTYGRMDTKEQAMQRPQIWWVDHLAPGWANNFQLEPVEE